MENLVIENKKNQLILLNKKGFNEEYLIFFGKKIAG